jgi:hypothetical protein
MTTKCSNKNAPLVDVKPCSNVAHIGFLPWCQTLKYTKWTEKIDQDWKLFTTFNKVDYDDNAFHVSSSSHERVNSTVLKYDKKYPSDISEEEYTTALRDLKVFFYLIKDQCQILDTGDVDANPLASCGVVFKKFFGTRDAKGKLVGISDKETGLNTLEDYIEYFWEHAHELDYPWLWKQSGKVEMLKVAKLLKDDIRGFTIIPLDAFVFTARLCQDMNRKMCLPEFFQFSPMKHGINLSRGGFIGLLEELMMGIKNPEVVEGDCIKWDSGMMDILFRAIIDIRFYCWDKKGMSEEEWWKRMTYAYRNIKESFICLTTGQIVQKMFGNPSGQTSTTDDNCIGHLFILCLAWRRLYKRSFVQDYRTKINVALYADDHIMCVEKDLEFGDFQKRVGEYRRVGCDLSPEKDLVTSDFEGHTFLGLTAHFNSDLGIFVPFFSSVRALNTLSKYEKNYTTEQVFERASVVLYLTCFDDQCFTYISKFLQFLRNKYAGVLGHRKIPTQGSCQSFWLCQEGGGLDGDKNQPEEECLNKLLGLSTQLKIKNSRQSGSKNG